jgi:hypothetical protein
VADPPPAVTITTRFKPWLCGRCGYLMDAASGFTVDATPVPGDLSICLNCGESYTLAGGGWRKLTAAELAALLPEERRELALAQLAQARAGFPDLAKRGGGRA